MRTGIAEAPTTVCHGDFRGDNLMFDDRAHPAHPDDEVAVLDWQIAYRGPAVTDVAYFLCQSLTVEERRTHERELVQVLVRRALRHGSPRGGRGARRLPVRSGLDAVPTGVAGTTVYPVTAMGAMDPANERGRELVHRDGRARLHRRASTSTRESLLTSLRSRQAEQLSAAPGWPKAGASKRGAYRAWWRRRPGRGQSRATRAPVPERVA